jgi:hypothetical protein
MNKIKKLQEEIDKVKVELVMSAYNPGLTNEGYKKRLKVLENQLYKEIGKQNGNSSILNT